MLKVKVTEDNLLNGLSALFRARNCPVALAIKDISIDKDSVMVGYDYAWSDGVSYKIPINIRKIIINYDLNMNMEPIEFELAESEQQV